jgi:hypothetical protein
VPVSGVIGGGAAACGYLRSKTEVRELFEGLEIVAPYPAADPDLTWVGRLDCEDPTLADSEGSRWLYCAVAQKTS